jgi:hypothetical protein
MTAYRTICSAESAASMTMGNRSAMTLMLVVRFP